MVGWVLEAAMPALDPFILVHAGRSTALKLVM